MSGFPVVGKEVVEPVNRMSAYALEDIAEVAEGGDVESFACDGENAEDRCGLPTSLAAEQQPLAQAQRGGGACAQHATSANLGLTSLWGVAQ